MVDVRIGDEELRLTWEAWEERVAAGRIPSDALVRFAPVTGSAWRQASELAMYRSARSRTALAFRELSAGRAPPLLTMLLLGAQIRLWGLAVVPGIGGWMERYLTKWTAPVLEDGEVWRLLTMGGLHLDFGHLLVNSIWLAYTGWHLERALGPRNLGMLFFSSVLGGSVASLFGSPDVPSLGSSGGVFGLVAACVVFGLARPEILPPKMQRTFGFALLPYLVLMLLSGLSSDSTDNWSHLGGALVGGVLALWVDPPGMERHPRWAARWQGLIAATAALGVGTLSLAGPYLMPLQDDLYAARRSQGMATRALRTDADRPLAWRVPAGWRRGGLLDGSTGYRHPTASRAWVVRQRTHPAPVQASALLSEHLHRLEVRGVVVREVTDMEASTGQRWRIDLRADGREMVERVWVQPRGLDSLMAVWDVEAADDARLRPLHRRLLRGISWPTPSDLTTLREEVARYPDDARRRRRLASRLAQTGHPEQALSQWRQLLDRDDASPETVAGYLRTLRWYPSRNEQSEDAEQRIDHALALDAGPEVEVEAARLLVALDRPATAEGLIEIAWRRRPGERVLAAYRRTLGLSNALDHDGRPMTATWDAREDRPATPPPLEGPPSRPHARRLGRAMAQARAHQADRARRAVADRDGPEALRALLLWRDGHPPAEPEGVLAVWERVVRRHAPALDVDPEVVVSLLEASPPEALARALRR